MKDVRRYIQRMLLTALLLLAGGAAHEAWATDVTYHILTLPINPEVYDYQMLPAITDKRLEAAKITVKDQTTLELPAQYKSPLATEFTYYSVSDPNITKSASAQQLFANNQKTKGYTYVIGGSATSIKEGTVLEGSSAEYYVVYTYNSSNTIAQLNGSIRYNIKIRGKDGKGKDVDKGFVGYNRGRNNRPAVLPTARVSPSQLSEEDFTRVDVSGTGVSPYWKHNDNHNKEEDVASQFHFMFKFEGVDPYNIIVRTAYDKDSTYIEKNDGTSNFVYKWYKEGSLFAVKTSNTYFASDEHKIYNIRENKSTYPTNPTDLREGDGLGYNTRPGQYHGQASGPIWNSVALLNSTLGTGYILMGSRTVDDDSGTTPDAPYFLKEANNCNNLVFNQIDAASASNNFTIEGLYPVKKVSFRVVTPFYAIDPSDNHIVSMAEWVSQYTIDNEVIESKYLPLALRRKFCDFTDKFYKDVACTQPITKFDEAEYDALNGYKVYVGYKVAENVPFKSITPKSSYTADELKTAVWYELTDAASTQADGKKLKYNSPNFMNNGNAEEYDKMSEFAFIGDPYEMRVIYRDASTGGTPTYVGATGDTPSSGTSLTTSTSATAGYKWELPYDAPAGSFLMRQYKGNGYWLWQTDHFKQTVSYATKSGQTANVVNSEAQTLTFSITNFTSGEGNYFKMTSGGTNPDQITDSYPELGTGRGGIVGTDGTATVTVKNSGGVAKSFTLTVQEYDIDDVAVGSSMTFTVSQGTTPYAGNVIQYSTADSTRVKVMDLPQYTYTYNIVDKSGRIALSGSIVQTIFTPLSTTVSPILESSLPPMLVSPFLVGDETLTFYGDTYVDGSGRGSLSSVITETPAVNNKNIYVTYTTRRLSNRAIKLSQEQEFNVVLNGEYLWYDSSDNSVKSSLSPTYSELKTSKYLWKLRNRDPYAMLLDSKGAREDLEVSGDEEVTMYNDAGAPETEIREKGAWVTLASIANEGVLSFTKRRSAESEGVGLYAQRFVAKSSLAAGIYEVMVATGSGVDASSTYYNIGRPAENTVKIYDQAHYAHGRDELVFRLEQTVGYTYHLIDKAKHELLTLVSQNPDLALPADYQSPLVSKYHFYDQNNITKTEKASGDEYEPKEGAEELTKLVELEAEYNNPEASDAAEWDSPESDKQEATSDDDMLEKAKMLETTGYHYYRIGPKDGPYTYKKINVTKAFSKDIYVTYDVNNTVKFNTTPYILKFLEPFAEGYKLEDGVDRLTEDKIQAVYPYCNGDGSLNVYGELMHEEQMGGGASTRTRWTWFLDSKSEDPYHVRIRSRNTISYSSVSHNTYLQTYAVHFNQDPENKLTVVTGGALPTIASDVPTEYMVLGSFGRYRLMTTYEIKADLNGDGDTEDDDENARHKVTSLEQYWKTYNMLKLDVLGISSSTDAYSTDESTWVVPDDKRDDLEAALVTKGVGAGKWHSYSVYANAVRWNGYNDKSDGHTKKVVERLEHWFQTFDMGNGYFDILNGDVPPVLVLLDRHGWEIMRRPLPTSTYPAGDEELAALRVYDSPLVGEYKFYSNATKATGCHKYTLRMQDGAERDQIKVNGVQWRTTSLADLPPLSATGVVSGGVIQDQYVTYTVKEEYDDNYAYDLELNEEDHTFTETGLSQPYLMLQSGRFYKDKNTLAQKANDNYITKPITEHTDPEGGNVYDLIISPHNHGGTNNNIVDGSGNFIGNIFWRIKPNLNIDGEMGIVYGTSNDTTTAEPLSEYGTKKKYQKKTGFDPYNFQVQLVNNNDGDPDGRYLTTHMTSSRLHDGIMIGDYTGSGGSKMVTLEEECTSPVHSEGYDHTNLNITNQTFMAVSDANGNMQLMPRFDHTLRVDLEGSNPWETWLDVPVDHDKKASAEDNASQGRQTTFFVRPQRLHYHIIDNFGREALGYKRAADYYPTITDHFKSPLAKDFTYYTGLAVHGDVTGSNVVEWGTATAEFRRSATTETLMRSLINLLPTAGTYYYRTGTRGDFSYYKVEVTKGFVEQQITGSFAATGLYTTDDPSDVDEDVYVRYDYNEEDDLEGDRVLQGQWFTLMLAEKSLQADGQVMKFTRLVPNDAAYAVEKEALSSDGVYYFRIGMSPTAYTYKKVTVEGGVKTDTDSTVEEWSDALNIAGLGVDLYAGEGTLSGTAEDDTEYASKRDALEQVGDYYFRIGTGAPYTYKKVTVTTVPITSASDYTETTGEYATLWANSKPLVVDADFKQWQWKLFVAPTDPSSDYYVAPDPYAVQLFNRQSNYTANPSLEPSPMAVGIKVPNEASGADRFALLSHPNGGYGLVVAKDYERVYTYPFLNGASMTVPTATPATIADEGSFTYKVGAISIGAQILVSNNVVHNFVYNVINNDLKLAVSAGQTDEEAANHEYKPYLPAEAQTPLLNMEDYEYYGFSTPGGKDTPLDPSDDTYTVIPQTLLYTLSGLYDDVVWVRYGEYSMDKTKFKVPNKRNETGTEQVARDPSSVDVSMNINGELPYNIIWYGDNIMQSTDNTSISGGGSQNLSGNAEYVWYFEGNDPYALKIKHKKSGSYIDGTTTLTDDADAKEFMLLKKDGYDYGILQVMGTIGDAAQRLTGYGGSLTADASTDPNKFIIFGLSIHDLIYRLIIAKTCPDESADPLPTDQYVDIPFRETQGGDLTNLRIFGSTQRDLTSVNEGEGTHYPGEKYQLGTTLAWGGSNHTYCYDAGSVSIGDDLVLPNIFSRPNCTFEFYIQGIFSADGTTSETGLDGEYKGLKLNKLMSDAGLIDKTVVVNVVYSFDKSLKTNAGMDFVRKTEDNLWYTYEGRSGETPYLAHYTNAWGLQSVAGRETHYTNDYLWTPLGDVYGFKMYNRYMLKNSGGTQNVMTMDYMTAGENLYLAVPGTTLRPDGPEAGTPIPEEYGIFELLPGDVAGYFRVHPVANTQEQKLYVYRDPSDNYTKLSTTPSDWTFGLDMAMLRPYYIAAGYVGGLTTEGKAAYTVAEGKNIREIQKVVYNDGYIVPFTPGYYRLHSMPGTSGITPVRYASGYLHDIEKTAVSGGIPMHFYSREGVTSVFVGEGGLESGFTVTAATRGDIPIASTERDPSTIFYFPGDGGTLDGNPRSTIQTQGLYVAANPNGDPNNGTTTSKLQRAVMTDVEGDAITFSLMDIGGAVLLIHDGAIPATRRYLNFDQSNEADKYDLKYYHDSPTDDARWCMQPIQKTGAAGDGEMPLVIATNNGGDSHYYATFCAPYDVLLPADAGGHTYNAYICTDWHDEGINPVAVPEKTIAETIYGKGKFVPAGTPVIIRTNDESESVTLTLPSVSSSEALSCIFTGSYLEKKLDASNPARDVFTLGLPMTSDVSKDGDYVTSGGITAPLPVFASSGVGFYVNATPNKEADALQSLWFRNNLYVLHNKIYYRADPSSGAREVVTRSAVNFVPVLFGDELIEQPDPDGGIELEVESMDNQPIYDLAGRRLSEKPQKGFYIQGGKKFFVR